MLKINESFQKNETIVFSTNCSIKYSGRAESFLPDGDRIIIIKSDGTLLVHQPKGNNPINYMKENTEHRLVKNEKGLFLLSQNPALKEFMDIKLNKVHFINSQYLIDEKKIEISGTEKDMAEMIYRNPGLISHDFRPLSMEEHTKYGFIDVFGHDRNNTLVIVECKRYKGDLSAVTQLRRYVEKIRKSKGLEKGKVRGILACPGISPNARKMLEDWGFEWKQLTPPNYLERHDKKQKKLGEY